MYILHLNGNLPGNNIVRDSKDTKRQKYTFYKLKSHPRITI